MLNRLSLAFTLAALTGAIAPAAQAADLVVSGGGKPHVPSEYLSVETARTVPDGETVASFGYGAAPGQIGMIGLNHGLGMAELGLQLGYLFGGAPIVAMGYKTPVGWLGPFNTAALAQVGYDFGNPPDLKPSFQGLLGFPFDAYFGPGVLTLQPRLVVQRPGSTTAALIPAVMGGYALPMGGTWWLFAEGTAGWSNGFAPAAKGGLRYTPHPGFAVDLQGGWDPSGVAVNFLQPQVGTYSATVRLGF